MSAQMSSISGMFRRARKIPETLLVSPTFMSTPYFLGISISWRQMSTSPLKTVHKTPSAPLSASILSSVGVILTFGHSITSAIFSQTCVMFLRFSAFVSISANSASLNASNVKRSRIQLVVNCKLPAPIKANFIFHRSLYFFLHFNICLKILQWIF